LSFDRPHERQVVIVWRFNLARLFAERTKAANLDGLGVTGASSSSMTWKIQPSQQANATQPGWTLARLGATGSGVDPTMVRRAHRAADMTMRPPEPPRGK